MIPALRILLLTCVLAAGAAGAAQAYRWVDREGEVHFGDHPPEDAVEVEAIGLARPADAAPAGRAPTSRPERPAPDPASGDDDDRAADLAAARSAYDAQRCELARARLNRIESARNVYQRGPAGSERILSADERRQRVRIARDSVRRYCR